jgi:hypothetical protein
MARMFPERLPAEVASDAERRLFETFRTEFSEDWVVFSQIRWLARQRRGQARDGEADFVIAHPRRGILVLEVKGGGIRHDGPSGKWFSTDREENEHEIKDPFAQAQRSMYALREKLRDSPTTSGCAYPLAYAVVFPDIFVEGDLGPAAPKEIVIDQIRARDLKQAVIDVFRYRKEQANPPGDEAIEALVELLGRSWQISTTIGNELEERERRIKLLTDQQFQLLDFLGNRRRALISGCAGSGKTMLGMEKARRLAHEGYRVLLTCYNQNLGNWLSAQVEGEGIEAHRFLSLCAQTATKAGIVLEKRPGESDEGFFDRFPDLLVQALEVLPEERYDAIIVDEGQDFEEEWWAAILCLLSDPNEGALYIFYDDNQRLYDRSAAFPITDEPFPLSVNCRNTQQIHDAVMAFYKSDTLPVCVGPEGEAPQAVYYQPGANERHGVESLIDDLVGKQNVRPGDIALLTRRSRERGAWTNPPRRPAWTATWELKDAADKVFCSTVHGFKGLERPVIIVCELQGVDPEEETELLYVAFSRARSHLIVVGLGGPP